MKVYRWDSFERRFVAAATDRRSLGGEAVVVKGLQVDKGEALGADVASDELLIWVLKGRWQMTIANGQVIVGQDEAVIIPSGFSHSAKAIEGGYALRMAPRPDAAIADYLWGI